MELYKINIRLFDDGGGAAGATGAAEGGAGDAGAGTDGGGQRDFNAEFDELIAGDYKDAYKNKMQAAIKDRLKGSKQQGERLKSAEELLALVGERYGQDGTDFDSLRAALENDRKYLEDEALEKGMTVEQLAEFKRMERENRAYQQEIETARQQREFEQRFAQWNAEADALANLYPELNLLDEFDNPQFVKLLDSGVGVKAAYQATHFDELMGGALQHTAAVTEKKVLDGIRAGGQRPTENGTRGSSGASAKMDVSKLTKQQRAELIERARRNPDEPITFR